MSTRYPNYSHVPTRGPRCETIALALFLALFAGVGAAVAKHAADSITARVTQVTQHSFLSR